MTLCTVSSNPAHEEAWLPQIFAESEYRARDPTALATKTSS